METGFDVLLLTRFLMHVRARLRAQWFHTAAKTQATKAEPRKKPSSGDPGRPADADATPPVWWITESGSWRKIKGPRNQEARTFEIGIQDGPVSSRLGTRMPMDDRSVYVTEDFLLGE